MQCQRCKETPGYHSFEYLTEISGNHFFYCFPAHNKQSVRTHEDMLNFVGHFPKDKSWSLVFHANGYGLSHMMPLSVAMAMGRLVQEDFSETLQKIYIVQGSWFMNFMCRCIFPFLTKKIREKFILVEGSLLEVMGLLEKEGLPIRALKPLKENFVKFEG
jgi:hypothetical protein